MRAESGAGTPHRSNLVGKGDATPAKRAVSIANWEVRNTAQKKNNPNGSRTRGGETSSSRKDPFY